MLKELPPGDHVVHFRAALTGPAEMTFDVTYELTISP